MTEAITPKDLVKEKKKVIPDFVIRTINRLIAKNWNGSESKIFQESIVQEIYEDSSYTREDIFKEKWLEFEDVYREAGWKVEYDKPSWNESGKAYFLFTKDVENGFS